MWNRALWILGILAAGSATALEGFPQRVIDSSYETLAPTMCVVSYSFEEPSQNSSRTTKQNATTLGVIVRSDGLVMVRGHVAVESVKPYNIRVRTGMNGEDREYIASYLGKPQDVNVAFLRLQSGEPLNLPTATFAPDAQLNLGEPLLVLGMLGDSLDNARAYQFRFVSAILDEPRTTYALDTPMPYGFIGGPVIDSRGRVVGVMGYDLSPEEGGEFYIRNGHPLLFQAGLFTGAIDAPPGESEDQNKPEDAWLGVFTQPLTDDLAEYWGLPARGGVVISTLVSGSPAEKAGLQRGDVVVEFNGAPVRARQDRDVLQFTRAVRDAGLGANVPLRVLRDGQPVELSILLAARPKSASEAQEHEDAIFGMTVRELTTDVRLRLNIPDSVKGVLVFRVRSGSWADLAEIPVGLLVLTVNDQPVGDVETYKAVTEKLAGEKTTAVTVFGQIRQETMFFRMEPKWPVE